MKTNITDLKLLSVAQVAEILSVNESTVRRLVYKNKIPTVQVSDNTYRFHPDMIAEWITKGGMNERQN